ncbi:MAG: hypothetical protein KGO02_05880 [Alphaproteobacteria bacterium]|nr:hypothetical protein [Alphaproteobacteria bacterium]
MNNITAELLTFMGMFATVFVGLSFLVRTPRTSSAPAAKVRRALSPVRTYAPAVDIVMVYRDAQAFRTRRRVRISKTLRHRSGRLYLLGHYELASRPHTFRLDRVIGFESLDGMAIDRQDFVRERLQLPADLQLNAVGPGGGD